MEAKQVIVVRKDLGMRKGKIAAQVAHASMAVLLNRCTSAVHHTMPPSRKWSFLVEDGSALSEWLTGSFTKICVYVNSEEELREVFDKAFRAGLPHSLIEDAGKTEFNGIPTLTCCAIGPGYLEDIDRITGHLPLL